MKKQILFLLVGLVIISCSKELITNTKSQNDRLQFKSLQAFIKNYEELTKMTSKEELSLWAQSKNHSTLLNSDDPIVESYSFALQTILNKESEFLLNDSIIWFDNGTMFALAKKDDVNYSLLKKNPERCKIIGYITSERLGSDSGRLKSVNLYNGNINSQNQKQFIQQYYQPCGGVRSNVVGDRKYVHEIRATFVHDPANTMWTGTVYLKIKLEWKGSKNVWKPAGEMRSINVDVYGNTVWIQGPLESYTEPFSILKSYTCSGDQEITIRQMNNNTSVNTNPYYQVSMYGSIYQKVNGDITTNGWTNSGTLW